MLRGKITSSLFLDKMYYFSAGRVLRGLKVGPVIGPLNEFRQKVLQLLAIHREFMGLVLKFKQIF